MANVPPFTSSSAFPQEGLNALLSIAPKWYDGGSHTFGSLYVGLFCTPWATVQGYSSSNLTLNTGTYPVYELGQSTFTNSTGYARSTALTAGSWGANTTSTTTIGANTVSVQQTTYGGTITFTNSSTTTAWSSVAGIFIATGTSAGTAGQASGANCTVLYYAQFADGNTVSVSPGDSLSVTPTWISAPYAN